MDSSSSALYNRHSKFKTRGEEKRGGGTQVCSAVLLGTTPPHHLRLEDEGCDERKQLLVMLECFLRGLADVVLCRDLCATTRGTLALHNSSLCGQFLPCVQTNLSLLAIYQTLSRSWG